MTSSVLVALRVPADPMRAFDAFTRDIGSWWQPSSLFAITPGGDGTLAFEPGVGGRLYTILASGKEFEIGRISVWEPGKRLVFQWRQASFRPKQSTEVHVCFEAVEKETRISIEHRAWDTIPKDDAARHRLPERTTLEHVARWWRASLGSLQTHLTGEQS